MSYLISSHKQRNETIFSNLQKEKGERILEKKCVLQTMRNLYCVTLPNKVSSFPKFQTIS